jgi:hypothetical protein
MDQSQIDAICERLNRLERENRRLRRFGAACMAGFVLLLSCGAQDAGQGGLIKGEQLLLTSKTGDSSIAMGTDEGGLPAITLRRTMKGNTSLIRLESFVAPDGDPAPAVTFQRTVGRKTASMRVGLYVAADGEPVLRFRDQAMRLRYTLPH